MNFNNITGFKLKQNLTTGGEVSDEHCWIKIRKNKNELAKVELTTFVMYIRNNGNGITLPLSDDKHNYVMTTDKTINGNPINGSIYGFPLFDIKSDNWNLINTPLSDMSTLLYRGKYTGWENNPLILIDFTDLPVNPEQDSTDSIPLKYLVVRLTNSKEEKQYDYDYDFISESQESYWSTLVKYTFYGDIINPYECLELNSNFFVYHKNNIYHPAGTLFDNTDKSWIKLPNNVNMNTYTNFEIDIKSNIRGPYQDKDNIWQDLPNVRAGQSITNIMGYSNNSTIYSGTMTIPESLEDVWKENIELSSTATSIVSNNDIYPFVNLLWCSLYSSRHLEIFPVGVNKNNYKSRFIQNFVDIDSNDECIGGGYPATSNGLETEQQKHKNLGTIHLPRITDKPYFYKNINNNTGIWEPAKRAKQYSSIDEYTEGSTFFRDEEQFNTLKQSYLNKGTAAAAKKLDELNKQIDELLKRRNNANWETIPSNSFKVYFKLLFKPINEDEDFEISYKFGKNLEESSKITFFRYIEMDGVAEPPGTTYKQASRDNEKITIKWDKDSFDLIPQKQTYNMKHIIFFDIASGKSEHQMDVSVNNYYRYLINKKFNITSYIFQLRILNMNDDGNMDKISTDSGISFTPKVFNIDRNAFIDSNMFKYTNSLSNINYQPFRYNNIIQDVRLIFSKKYTNPLLRQTNEEYLYLANKEYMNGTNADIVNNSNSLNLVEDIMGFPREINSNIFQITPFLGETNNSGNIILFTTPITQTDIPIFRNKEGNKYINIGGGNTRLYPVPNMTKINNKFISDYWEWIDQISFVSQILILTAPDLVDIEIELLKQEYDTINQDYFITKDIFINILRKNYTPEQIPDSQIDIIFDFLKNQDEKISLSRIYQEKNKKKYKYSYYQSKISTYATLNNIYYESENSNQIKYILINTFNNSNETHFMDLNGNKVYNPRFRALGTESLMKPLDERPIILSITGGGSTIFNTGIYYIGNDGSVDPSQGINKKLFDWTFKDIFNSGQETIVNTNQYNSVYNIFITGAKLISQNQAFSGVRCLPYPIEINLVELNTVEQFWPRKDLNGIPIQNYEEMVQNDSKGVVIEWNYYNNVDKTNGNIYWKIKKKNLVTLEEIIINETHDGLYVKKNSKTIDFSENNLQSLTINENNNTYKFIDREVLVYDKYLYTIEGIFKWDTLQINEKNVENPLSIFISGFTTIPIFLCKNNRFKFGRFNTTSTNLKLFKPLKNLNNCSKVNYNVTRKIQTSNNIYNNTTNHLTKKQIYKYLASTKYRPFR